MGTQEQVLRTGYHVVVGTDYSTAAKDKILKKINLGKQTKQNQVTENHKTSNKANPQFKNANKPDILQEMLRGCKHYSEVKNIVNGVNGYSVPAKR